MSVERTAINAEEHEDFESIPTWIIERRKTLEYKIEGAKFAFAEEVDHLMEARGVTKAELARRLDCSRAWVTQLLNTNANPTLATMVKIAEALEGELRVKVRGRGGE